MQQLGTLYGRNDVVRFLGQALARPGALVTLTGLPGSGRTSVAHAAAHQVSGPDGPAVIEGRRAMLPGELAEALQAVSGPSLVLVDDADHAPAARQQLGDHSRAHRGSALLLTASTPLGLPGELVVRLSPLPVPDPTDDPAVLRTHPAVQLFADVYARTGTSAVLDESSVAAAARICALVGGLPLGIRLVAARTVTYSPATLASLLARAPMAMLRSRSGDPEEAREHDLVAAIEWSVALLTPGERVLLHDLTVFRGPVDLEVLDEVCARPDLVDELSALVDVHLVDPLHEGQRSRFTIPPLVREHLDAAEDCRPSLLARERHCRWALGVAARSVALEAAGRLADARRITAPVEADLMAALADAVAARDGEAARTLCLAIVPVAFSRGATTEVCRAVDSVQALLHSSRREGQGMLPGAGRVGRSDELTLAAWRELLRAETSESARDVSTTVPALGALREQARRVDERTLLRVTYVAVQAARFMVRRETAEGWAREGRELAARLGDPARLVRLETWTGMMAHQRGAYAEAATWAHRALSRARALDDPGLELAPAGLLHGLPRDEAARHTSGLPTPDQLVRHARELGELHALDWLEPTAAFADLRSGDVAGACGHSASTLRRARVTGARLRAGPPLLCLFLVSLQHGDLDWAGRLQGIVGRYLDVLRPSLPPDAAAAYDRAVQRYRAAAATRADAASDVISGLQLSWDEAVDAALTYAAHAGSAAVSDDRRAVRVPQPDDGDPKPVDPVPQQVVPRMSHVPLTLRERDVLHQLTSGGTNREISAQLGISAKTVMHHTSSIYRKLGVRGRAEAVAWSLRTQVTRLG